MCGDLHGNADGDWIGCIEDQSGINGDFTARPHFCDVPNVDLRVDANSPGLPGNHPDGDD